MMRASTFEFRNRVWIITLIFLIGFGCSAFDHRMAGRFLSRTIAGADANSARLHSIFRIVFGAGTLFILAGAMIRTWAAAHLRSAVVHDANLRTEGLVADGPYRYVRNPLYLGTLLMTMGIGLLGSPIGWFVLVIAMLLFELRLMFREEAELSATQGESYGVYCAAVPRLWPALRPRVRSSGARPQWMQGFAGELMMWGLAAALGVYALTLKLQYTYWLIALSVAFLLLIVPLWKRLAHPRPAAVNAP